jgi:integrase
LPALGKELFQVLDPLISHHGSCLPLSLSKYEESRPTVTPHPAEDPGKRATTRPHLAEFGTSPDGRLFSGVRGGELPTITYRRAWVRARQMTLTAAEQASPLARRPYDLRHACLSTWLNGGVYPTQVAEWAGHSVDVLLRIYAKCVVGQDELAKRRISDALRQD